jgi:hypothetical protein
MMMNTIILKKKIKSFMKKMMKRKLIIMMIVKMIKNRVVNVKANKEETRTAYLFLHRNLLN